MKSLIAVLAFSFLGSFAHAADTTLFKCIVDAQKPTVSLLITLADDVSADFVTMSLTDKGVTTVFFNQLGKGEVTQQIQSGAFQMLTISDKSADDNGVLKNTGIIALSKEQGTFGGFLSALGNIYPLSCQAAIK